MHFIITSLIVITAIVILAFIALFIGGMIHYGGFDLFLEDLDKYWILVAFPLCGGILGYRIVNSNVVGKVLLGILFAGITLIITLILNTILTSLKERFKKKSVKIIIALIEIILCVLFLRFALTRPYVKYHKADPVYYDKYGKKHYSEKERDNANFKYDAYKAADEYRKSHPSAK